MTDSRDLTKWKAMTAEETRLRSLLTSRPISEASYVAIQKDPHRKSTVLAERLQALFSLTGIQPDAAGYRRLLLAMLSDDFLGRKLTGLRQPRTSTQAKEAQPKRPPQHMIGPLRTVASLTAQGFSKAAAIRRAVEEQNGIADHLDLCAPLPGPRKKITIDSLKKEEQRTRLQAKCLPDTLDDVALDAELDRHFFAAALEASAPRSDRWVDELSRVLEAHRQGRIDRSACRQRLVAALDAELEVFAIEQDRAAA